MEKSKILIKIALDLLYIGIILIVYFANIFTYMYNFQIGITHLTVNIESDWFTMHKKEPFAYYKDSLCDVSYNSNKDICDGLMAWEVAGILYLIFSAFSFVFASYGLLRLSGKYLDRDFTIYLKNDSEQFVYPALYALALILYLIISQVLVLKPPNGLSSDWGVETEPGIVLMFAALLVSLGSTVYFILIRKEIEDEFTQPLLIY